MIKISVIVPCYNIERDWLLQCIHSILNQDFQEYELLLVDDGSEEPYAVFLEEAARMDNRICLIRQDNQGASAARNTGVKNAKGEYITFIDADDWVVPFFFSEAYRIAAENSLEYVVGGSVCTRSREIETPRNQDPVLEVVDAVQYRPPSITGTDQFEGGGNFGRGPVARLVKRTLLDCVLFPEDVKLGEDIIWNLDVLAHCEKVCLVYQIWYIYWENPVSVTHKYNEQIIPICEKQLEELKQRINWQEETEVKAYFHRMFELLSMYVFRCYPGNKECPLSRAEKRRLFRDLCKREPWTSGLAELPFRHCDRNTQMKYLLMRFGPVYGALSLRDRRRSGEQK